MLSQAPGFIRKATGRPIVCPELGVTPGIRALMPGVSTAVDGMVLPGERVLSAADLVSS